MLELNLTAATLFGREREHVIGKAFSSLVLLEDPKRFWQHLGACAARNEPAITELPLKVRDLRLWVEAVSVPVLGLLPDKRTFRTAFADITRRKRAEAEREEALESERRLRQRVEAIARAHLEASQALAVPGQVGLHEVLTTMASHALTLVNANWVRVELLRQSHLLNGTENNSDAIELGHPGSDLNAPKLTLQIAYGGRALAQLYVARTNGVPLQASPISGAPCSSCTTRSRSSWCPCTRARSSLGTISFGRQSDQGYDLRLMTWAQEIAERCASALDTATLLEELREALTFREHLMAMISHDLKSPLNAISLSATSLLPDEPSKERRSSSRQVQLIQRSAAHMNNMINDLLANDVCSASSPTC